VWPILNGDRTSGVTLHVIDRGIDTGDIIDQIAFPLTDNMTCRDLYIKYNEQGFELFKRNIHRLVAGTEHKAIPQAAANSTYHSRTSIDYGNLAIDLRKTACEIDRQVRAFYFPEYQVPRIHGYPIRRVAVLDRRSTKRPGTVIVDAGQYLEIATIDFDVRLFKEECLKA
jgi:methionyl-tRNA formyltransferase